MLEKIDRPGDRTWTATAVIKRLQVGLLATRLLNTGLHNSVPLLTVLSRFSHFLQAIVPVPGDFDVPKTVVKRLSPNSGGGDANAGTKAQKTCLFPLEFDQSLRDQ